MLSQSRCSGIGLLLIGSMTYSWVPAPFPAGKALENSFFAQENAKLLKKLKEKEKEVRLLML